MGVVPIDFAAVRVAIEQAGGQTGALLLSLGDAGTAVRRLHWTVRDMAAHLATDVQTNADAAAGLAFDLNLPAAARTPQRMATLNARAVSEVPESDPSRLADLVEGACRASSPPLRAVRDPTTYRPPGTAKRGARSGCRFLRRPRRAGRARLRHR